MIPDFSPHLRAVERTVSALERDGEPVRAVTPARSFAVHVDDLWNALTDPGRLSLWFLPVHGDLRLGGRYRIEGNASGVIEACRAPSRLGLTWEFGGGVTWVEAHLEEEESGRARLALSHTAGLSPHWDRYGAGATGVGWEMALIGLAAHVEEPAAPPVEEGDFATPQAMAFIAESCARWQDAEIAGGTDRDAARARARRTTAFYTGQPED